MDWAGEGELFDGVSAAAQPVRVEIGDGVVLVLRFGQAPEAWPLGEVTAQRLGARTRLDLRRTAGVGPAILVEDPAVRVLFPKTGFGYGDLRTVVALCVLAAVIVFAGYRYALPWFADQFARRVPVEWEEKLGKPIAGALAPEGVRCGDAAHLQALERMAATLSAGSPYRIHLILAEMPAVNALAAPGGYIVVYRGLLDRMETPDQAAAVVAHEMQHVLLRHNTRAIARSFAGRVLLGLIAGDPTGGWAGAAGQLAELRYQRADEEAADFGGLREMARAGYDPRGMPEMLRRLREAAGSMPRLAEYLSSHPDTESRIANLERLSAVTPREGASRFSASDWRALKSPCGAATGASSSRGPRRTRRLAATSADAAGWRSPRPT